jgi:hypothetical protein
VCFHLFPLAKRHGGVNLRPAPLDSSRGFSHPIGDHLLVGASALSGEGPVHPLVWGERAREC